MSNSERPNTLHVMPDMESLQSSETWSGAVVWLGGYHRPGDGGEGVLYWDGKSRKEPNGGTVIRSTRVDRGRWLRPLGDGTLNVRWFGAKGDSETNDADAFQAALDEAHRRGGGVIQIPPAMEEKNYLIGKTLRLTGPSVSLQGSGRSSLIRAVKGVNLFDIYQGRKCNMDLVWAKTVNAHVFCVQNWGLSNITRCQFTAGGKSGSVLHFVSSDNEPGTSINPSDGYGMNDMLFHGNELKSGPNHETPIIDVRIGEGNFNANTFDRNRFQTEGASKSVCVRIISTHAQKWHYNNTFSNINFECPMAGAMLIQGCMGTVLANIGLFDLNKVKPTNHMFILGDHEGGQPTQNTSLLNVGRYDGNLSDTLVDVFLDNARGTVIINCGGSSTAKNKHNLNNQKAYVVQTTNDLLNAERATVVDVS